MCACSCSSMCPMYAFASVGKHIWPTAHGAVYLLNVLNTDIQLRHSFLS